MNTLFVGVASFFAGGFVMMIIMSLMYVASEADDEMERAEEARKRKESADE